MISLIEFLRLRRASPVIFILCACVPRMQAHAAGLGLHEQSAAGLSEAFAGTATGAAGLSSMFWNPATMSQNQGLQVSGTLSGLFPFASHTTNTDSTSGLLNNNSTAQTTGDILSFQALPAGYVSYQLDNRVWLGLGVNSPFGLNSKNPTNWAGAIYGATSELSTENINPNIAVKVTDDLTLAVGVQVEHMRARLTREVMPNNVNSSWITGTSWAAGYTLGATYYVNKDTVVGVGYRSRVFEPLSGRETVNTLAGSPPAIVNVLNNAAISSTIALPDMVTAGLSHQFNAQWQADFGYQFTRWSSFSSFPVVGGYTGQSLNFAYNNSWMASAGVQYHWSNAWTLKAGAAYETSPIDDANRTVRVPDANRIWASTGVTYKLTDRFSFDAGYAHVFVKESQINISGTNPAYSTSAPVYVGSTKAHVDIISFGLNYRWF